MSEISGVEIASESARVEKVEAVAKKEVEGVQVFQSEFIWG